MEYLMTYGWAILVIAVIITIIFVLGLFNGGASTPSSCVAQLGYTCANPSYTSGAVSFTFGQGTGKYYYSVNAFVASDGLGLDSSGNPSIGSHEPLRNL